MSLLQRKPDHQMAGCIWAQFCNSISQVLDASTSHLPQLPSHLFTFGTVSQLAHSGTEGPVLQATTRHHIRSNRDWKAIKVDGQTFNN
jgi:hypothetical protein